MFYWQHVFPELTGGKSVGPVTIRLDEFLAPQAIRNMVSQEANRLDFSAILDQGKILLVRLPQGLIGKKNTALLGSLVTAKLQMAAMSRQRVPAAQRRDFWCYMDEFQNFITPSMAEILGGTRKYRLGMILAHQELRHLDADRDVASAVLSNSDTRVVFKVGDADARSLEGGFSHFEMRDLLNLGKGEAVCRVERSDDDFNLVIPQSALIDEAASANTTQSVVATSRAKYARPRSEVEAELARKWDETARARAKEPRPKKATPDTAEPAGPDPEETPPADSVPKSTPVEPNPAPEPPPPIVADSEPEVVKQPTQIGRGGSLHIDTQRRIKHVAEELGFSARMEAVIGRRGMDLLLERDSLRIAVEFSSTTGVTHELQNILKCLTGDFTHIAMVSGDSHKLMQIQARLRERVTEEFFLRVGFYEVEPFLDYLRLLPKVVPDVTPVSPQPKAPSESKVMGWTITTEIVEQTDEERRDAKARILDALGEALRKPPAE